eukprot:8312813-Alexandrium_andersonii.AAC.1
MFAVLCCTVAQLPKPQLARSDSVRGGAALLLFIVFGLGTLRMVRPISLVVTVVPGARRSIIHGSRLLTMVTSHQGPPCADGSP